MVSRNRAFALSRGVRRPGALRVERFAAETLVDARPRIIDRVAFGAFVVAGYIVPTIDGFSSGTLLEDALWIVAFVAGIVGLARDRVSALALVKRSLPLLALLAVAAASTAWSDDPATTARRSFALIITATLSLFFVCRLGLKAFVTTLAIATGVVAAASAVLVALVPGVGIGSDGDWVGFLSRKNALGQVMVLGIVTIFCAMKDLRGAGRGVAIATMILMAVLLVGSRSGTSTVIALLLAGGCPILLWSRMRFSGKPKMLFALALLACVGAGVVSTVGQDTALNALGKDATLTGRTDVWQFATDAIRERPFLGYGYKVFWLSAGAADPGADTGTWATQAHNGLIEVGLDLGVVGMTLLVIFAAVALTRAGKTFWDGRDRYSAWPLFVVIAILITNFTEATLVKYYDVSWMVFVAAVLFATEANLRRDADSPRVPPRGRGSRPLRALPSSA